MYDPRVCVVIPRLAPADKRLPEGQDLMLFLPHDAANRGSIACWDPVSGHGEASLDFFRSTRAPWAFQKEAQALVKRYESLLAHHGEQTLRQLERLPRQWTRYAWRT